MIKTALKNFFKNLVYVFVSMGVVYLFVLLAVFILIGSLVEITGDAFMQALELVRGTVDESSASVNAYLDYAFKQLQWNGNIIDTVIEAFRARWLTTTLKGFFGTLADSSADFSAQLDGIVNEFLVKLRAIISAVIILCVTGIVLANLLTRYMVRRRTAKRGLKKYFIARTVLPIVESIFVAGSVAILAVLQYYGILVVAAMLILSGAFSLTSSWIVHRTGGLKMKDVVTFKNILRYIAAAGVILLIDIAIAVALVFASPLLAVLVAVPVVLYSLSIIGVNTDSFVCEMIASREKQRAAAGAIAAAEGGENAAAGAPEKLAPESPAPAQKSSRKPRKKGK